MWAQYKTADASPAQIQATTNNSVDATALAAVGLAQISMPDTTESMSMWMIDTTSTAKAVSNLSAAMASYCIGSTSTYPVTGTLTLNGSLQIDGKLTIA